MNFKTLRIMLLTGALGCAATYFAYEYGANSSAKLAAVQSSAGGIVTYDIPDRKNLYGDYLGSQFAQQHHDWKRAGNYLGDVLMVSPDDGTVLKRAMILAMGAGEVEKSVSLAERVLKIEDKNALALLFLACGSMHHKDYAQADKYIKQMPPGSLSDFIMPLLQGWTEAGIGQFHPEKLSKNIIHMHHAILMADMLGKKDEIEKLLRLIVATQPPVPDEMERIGDIYMHIGNKEKAKESYEAALKELPGNTAISSKIADIENGKDTSKLESIKAPEQGVAMALYNMAQLLYQESADESARVFGNIALYLYPEMTDAQLLLAAITSRNERYSDAIEYYRSVKADSEYYLESRRRAAELLETAGRTDEALAELNMLAKDHHDLESLIRVGDIYRRKEDFQKAVTAYNDAAKQMGDTVPKEYWHLLYARGMSLERLGDWKGAEADLKMALSYQPDHPYVLNYLGYAWTDKGENLDQALAMIKKAATLRPEDGYITDSLGWVYYRRGEYQDAVKPLETAVELLPYDPVINDHLGDAYWQVGRKLEAEFQWQRAKNFSKDAEFITGMDHKLADGLTADDVAKQTHSSPPPATAAVVTPPTDIMQR